MDKAQRFDPDQLRRAARRAIAAVEPDAALVDAHENEQVRSEEELARDKTELSMRDNGDGTTTGHFTVPTTAAAFLRKIIESMTSPRRMRSGTHRAGERCRRRTRGRTHDWDHRRGLAFAELLEHLPTDHLHDKTAATVVVTICHEVLQGRAQGRPPRHRPAPQRRRGPPARLRRRPDPGRPRRRLGRPRPRPRSPALLPGPARRQGPRARHLRRRRLRTPLRLVRAPPPETLEPRRQDRPRQRRPAVPLAPPTHPRPGLRPPLPARRQRPLQQAAMRRGKQGHGPGCHPPHGPLPGARGESVAGASRADPPALVGRVVLPVVARPSITQPGSATTRGTTQHPAAPELPLLVAQRAIRPLGNCDCGNLVRTSPQSP